MDNEVKAQPAVLQMVVEIKRAATGQVDTYTLTGTPIQEKEADDGRDPQHSVP